MNEADDQAEAKLGLFVVCAIVSQWWRFNAIAFRRVLSVLIQEFVVSSLIGSFSAEFVCFFVFRVVTVCDHPPNAYAFGSSQKQNSAQKHHCHHHCYAWLMRWQPQMDATQSTAPLRVVSSLSRGL